MPKPQQKVVFTWGAESFLLYGDPDREAERYWTSGPDFHEPIESTQAGDLRAGCALPVLLGEGWIIRSIQPAATGSQEHHGGSALILLERDA